MVNETRLIRKLILFGMLINIICPHVVAQPYKLAELKCENLQNPLGIDASHPRLSWQLKSGGKGVKQRRYSLTVGIDSTELVQNHTRSLQWQISGSSTEQLVIYQGKALL